MTYPSNRENQDFKPMSKETVGEYLRKERELRQISIEEVAEGTKISVSRLRLIEKNRFDDLPAEVFVRGFIRNYASYIGLDPEEAILRLEEDLKGESITMGKQPEMVSTTTIDVGYKRPRHFLGLAAGIILLILVGAGIYYFFFSGHNPSVISTESNTSAVDTLGTVNTGANESTLEKDTSQGPKVLLEEESNDTKETPALKNVN